MWYKVRAKARILLYNKKAVGTTVFLIFFNKLCKKFLYKLYSRACTSFFMLRKQCVLRQSELFFAHFPQDNNQYTARRRSDRNPKYVEKKTQKFVLRKTAYFI